MKSFETLVLAYLKDSTGPLLDPLQFPYRANRSVDDAVNMGLHYILQHLDRPGTYVRILFVDFSSALTPSSRTPFRINWHNSPSSPPSVSGSPASWQDRQQLVRLGKFSSNTCTISTGAPQGCVLSPLLLLSLHEWLHSKDPSVKLLKFADDTTLISLIQDGDESAYRQEVKELAVWCSLNNLELNTLKTVEMIVELQEKPPCSPPLTIMNSTVTAVEVIQVPGHHHLSGPEVGQYIVSIVRKAQQRLYFLHQLRKFNRSCWNSSTLPSLNPVLCTSITVWFSSATKSDLRRLRRVVRTAERIIGNPSPLSKNCTYPEWAKGLAKSLWTPHIQHTPSLNCCRLVDYRALSTRTTDTELSSLKLSISWTLDIKRGTHNTIIHYLFTTHTYIIYINIFFVFFFFSFQICTCQTCTHMNVCIA